METCAFSPPKNLSEEGKWLFVVTSFEATNFGFIKANENQSFSISTPADWTTKGGSARTNRLRE